MRTLEPDCLSSNTSSAVHMMWPWANYSNSMSQFPYLSKGENSKTGLVGLLGEL